MSIKRSTKWSRTAQLPQTGYTLERRGGGEKQHNSLRLNTLWGVRWGSRTKCLPQFSALGRWGGEQFKTIVLRLVHLSTLKAIIVPASPLTAKLKFRIKMGWLDKIPKIEKKKGHSLTTFLQLGQQTVQHSQVQCMLSTHSSPSEF